jgi:rubredoxin
MAVGFNPYDAETGYWLGEWICADCGYIYGSRGEGQAFETLGRWYKCPQCAGPRRRFAKKLGEK